MVKIEDLGEGMNLKDLGSGLNINDLGEGLNNQNLGDMEAGTSNFAYQKLSLSGRLSLSLS